MTDAESTGLLLVGCGKMGGALLERTSSSFSDIRVVEPAPQPEHMKNIAGLRWLPSHDKLDAAFKPGLIVLAIKPQHMAEVLPAYARFQDSVFLSIAAGTTIARLGQLLGDTYYDSRNSGVGALLPVEADSITASGRGAPPPELRGDHAIVRAMPNLPASIGEGITAAVANTRTTPVQRGLCDTFLRAVGELVWLDDEGFIDIVTAYAGVPAYVFALVESLAKAGEALGLPKEMAIQFARQNIAGSGSLLAQSTESAEALRRAVTSPAGTTEAALKHIITEHGLDEMMLKALTAGTNRAKELAR